jgi:tight adherence protein C
MTMDFQSLSRPVILLLVFGIAVLLTWAALSYLGTYRAVRRRVATELQPATATGGASLRSQQTEGAWVRLVNFVEKRGLSLADTKGDQLRRKMIAAGFTHPAAPRVFTLLRLMLTLGLPASFLFFV